MNGKACLLALSVAACAAAEPESALLSADELREYCTAYEAAPDGEAGRTCISYIRGFIDGLTAARAETTEPPASWTERAARTRLGRSYEAKVMTRTECLDDPDAMGELISRVLEQIASGSSAESADARQLVLRIVREQSPCAA